MVRDRLLGPEPLADLDRLVDAPAARREVELRSRPTPPRARSRRCRTRTGRSRRCRASARRVPRRTGGAARCCRRACRAARARCAPRGSRGRRTRRRSACRRHRRVLLARVRRAAHRAREHEVLGQPHRLVAEPLGLERRVDVEVRVAARRARCRTSRASLTCRASVPSPALRCQPPAARLPPSTWIVVPVTKRDQSRREVHDRGRDVVDVTRDRQRRLHRHVAADARRRDHVGRDAVDPDQPVAELERERLREVHDRGLHRAVDREAGRGAVRLDRRDVDDRPARRRASAARTPGCKCVTLVKFSRISASWPLSFTSRNAAWKPPPALFTRTSTAVERRRSTSRTASPSRTSSSSARDAAARRLDLARRCAPRSVGVAVADRDVGAEARERRSRPPRRCPPRRRSRPRRRPVSSTESGVIGIGRGG